jgi:hypothetical protein
MNADIDTTHIPHMCAVHTLYTCACIYTLHTSHAETHKHTHHTHHTQALPSFPAMMVFSTMSLSQEEGLRGMMRRDKNRVGGGSVP